MQLQLDSNCWSQNVHLPIHKQTRYGSAYTYYVFKSYTDN